MKSFSSICEKVPRSAIRKMFAMADKIEDPISFAIGEPDFTTPSHIIDAANRALSSGETHYTPNIGILPLRQAIADYRNAMGLGYDPSNEIMITAGGMEALYLSLLVLLNPGDEVLLSNPGWTNYYGQILMCRAIPKRVPAYESEGFIVTPEELKKAITPKTKLLILNFLPIRRAASLPPNVWKRLQSCAWKRISMSCRMRSIIVCCMPTLPLSASLPSPE